MLNDVLGQIAGLASGRDKFEDNTVDVLMDHVDTFYHTIVEALKQGNPIASSLYSSLANQIMQADQDSIYEIPSSLLEKMAEFKGIIDGSVDKVRMVYAQQKVEQMRKSIAANPNYVKEDDSERNSVEILESNSESENKESLWSLRKYLKDRDSEQRRFFIQIARNLSPQEGEKLEAFLKSVANCKNTVGALLDNYEFFLDLSEGERHSVYDTLAEISCKGSIRKILQVGSELSEKGCVSPFVEMLTRSHYSRQLKCPVTSSTEKGRILDYLVHHAKASLNYK